MKPTNRLFLFSFVIFLLSLFLNFCNKSVEPIAKNSVLDTTGHNFVWEVDTLPGTVYDISAIDENNVWLVGEFREYNPKTDSFSYNNFGKWDGSNWNLESVEIHGGYKGIVVFDKNDIWLTNGIILHWNGKKWKRYHLWDMKVLSNSDGGVYKVFGLTKNNIFFIGNKGTIVHYNGAFFKKMDSGTSVDLTHIFALDEQNIWVVGDDRGLAGGQSVLLYYNGINWKVKYHYLYNEGPPFDGGPIGAYRGIWADKDSIIMGCGQGYWHESIKTKKGRIERFVFHPIGAQESIFAINRNDIFMVGQFYTLQHFNGVSWKRYIPFVSDYYNFYTGTFVSNDIVFIGGDSFVYRGYR